MPLHIYLVPFLTSLLLSLLLTPWVRNRAVLRGQIDPPHSGRHLHAHPVPRLGGIAIFVAFVGSTLISLMARRLVGNAPVVSIRTIVAILAASLVIFCLGFYDDLHELGANGKFAIQALAAILLYANGVGVHRIGFVFHGEPLALSIGLPLTVFWVLLITNAFNLIDGLDGLAAGSATFSTIIIFAISLLRDRPLVSFLAIALAGAMLGFLRYNLNPATIFLGDSGSLFIGFILSALALVGSQKATTMVAVAIPVISFGLPILDVTLSLARRWLAGKPLFSGDSDHIHHKLLKMGLSHRNAVLVLYAVTAGFGLLSLILLHGDSMIALVLCIIGLGVWLGVQQLHYAEFGELRSFVERAGQRRQVIVNNLLIRRATESLKTCGVVDDLCRILQETLQPLGFDGFSLNGPLLDRIPQRLLAPLQSGAHGLMIYGWCGSGYSDPEWEMKIELITSAGHRSGTFSVYRKCFENPLLVDIHLLNGEFRRALIEAVQRAIDRAQLVTSEREVPDARLFATAVSAD